VQRQTPASLFYLLVAVVAALYLAPTLTIDFGWQLFALAVALVGIGLYRMWLVPVVLLLVMSNLAVSEVPINFGPYHGLADLLMALVVLLFVVSASRYLVLSGQIVRYYRGSPLAGLETPIKRLIRRWKQPETQGVRSRDSSTFDSLEIATGLGRIVLAVAVAAIVLSVFRLDPSVGQQTGIVPTATRTIELVATLVIVLVAIYAAVAAVSWKFLTPAQARMVIRREVIDEHDSDLQRMARERQKRKR
jgi:hypothetical protein